MKANQTQITTTKTTGIKASVLMLFMTLSQALLLLKSQKLIRLWLMFSQS
ncbi:Uncharacterised protein [Acinetobacter lwoffii]|nr:Uncharacterised protein [Acinetobacter lwoffii]